jgi:threonine/homoserine/homoserine lactone efflux protein
LAVLPIWGYLAVTVPLVMIPGVSTALVLRNSVAGGVRAGLETAVGLNASSFCYGLLSAFGFAIALQRWPWAWALLRGVGALYLSWLGLQSIKRSVRPPRPTVLSTTAVGSAGGRVRNAREGFVTNTPNPSIATFYLVLLPQFIPRGAPVVRSALVLTAIHISLAAIWHVLWASAGGTLSRTLASGRPRRALELVSGAALLALAVKIAAGS